MAWRGWMRNLLAVAIAAVLPLAATAEETLSWFGTSDEYGSSLYYGIPESDHVVIGFHCPPGAGEVMFSYIHEPIRAEDGVEVTVTLQAGDIEVPISTTGVRFEMDDLFVLEGSTVLDERLADLLTSRGTLYVFVEDGAAQYALDGTREAAAPLLETCAAF